MPVPSRILTARRGEPTLAASKIAFTCSGVYVDISFSATLGGRIRSRLGSTGYSSRAHQLAKLLMDLEEAVDGVSARIQPALLLLGRGSA